MKNDRDNYTNSIERVFFILAVFLGGILGGILAYIYVMTK